MDEAVEGPRPRLVDRIAAFARQDTRSFFVVLVAGFLVGVALLSTIWAAQAGGLGTGTFAMSGSLTLSDTSSSFSSSGYSTSSVFYTRSGGPCFGMRGYSDIAEGAAVNVYDRSGSIVAIGRLNAGSGSYDAGCTFTFSVSDVPAGSDFYQVEVSHRGKINVTGEDAQSGRAAFTLGS